MQYLGNWQRMNLMTLYLSVLIWIGQERNALLWSNFRNREQYSEILINFKYLCYSINRWFINSFSAPPLYFYKNENKEEEIYF